MENRPIYRSSGFYFGFIRNGQVFSRDGIALGWVEGRYVWDYSGRFKGIITEMNSNLYILVNKFTLFPAQRSPRAVPGSEVPLPPVNNISAISLPVEVSDGF